MHCWEHTSVIFLVQSKGHLFNQQLGSHRQTFRRSVIFFVVGEHAGVMFLVNTTNNVKYRSTLRFTYANILECITRSKTSLTQ